MENYRIRFMAVIFVSYLVLSTSSFLFAEDTEGEVSKKSFSVKEGAYLEIFGVQNKINGEFDDTLTYYSSSALYDVPDVDPGIGFGIALGYRSTDSGTSGINGALDISYQRSSHDTQSSYVDIGKQTGYFNALDFNFKIDAFAKDEFRPYVLFGFGFPWLTITGSKVTDSSYEDETFVGISGNLGLGLAYFLNSQLCITGGYMYRWASYASVDGVSLAENVSGSGPSFRLGLAYTF